MYDPEALLQLKQSTSTRICTGENLYYMRDYIPYFELHAADVFMIDVPWNGFSQSKKVGDLAEVYQLNVAPTTTIATCRPSSAPAFARSFPTCVSWRSTSTTCPGRTIS